MKVTGTMPQRPIIELITSVIVVFISTSCIIGVECFQYYHSKKFYSTNHAHFSRRRQNQPWGGYRRRVKSHDIAMNLVPEDNQSIDPNRLSVSGVPYRTVLSGLKELYPPQDLSERNAISRTDGYWSFIKNGEEIPQGLTYGEFDFLFFAELLDRAHHHYFIDEKSPTNGWDGKVFVDIGSGTGRLVIGASALHPGFSKCKGLEVLNGIHEVSLQKIKQCKKYNEPDDSGHVIETKLDNDNDNEEEKNNLGELNIPIDERNDTEPLTSQMIEMQKALQQMTSEEWQDMMGDHVINDDDSVADPYVEKLSGKTDVEDTNTVDNDIEGEDHIEEITEAEEKTREYLKARNISYEIHPEYSIPPEVDLIASYGTDDDDAMKEHKFDSLGEFESLSAEEWKLIYGDNTVIKKEANIRLAEGNFQAGTREENNRQHKEDRGNKYVLRSPHDTDIASATTDEMNEAPLAPIDFLCGSFEDPYQYIGDADVAFVFSTCMTKDLMGGLSQAFGRQCKPGTIIITTDFKLHLEGYVDPVENDPTLPFGEFKFEVLEKIDGYCWLLGGESTAYIHRVVQSLWVDMDEDEDSREMPKLSTEEEAVRIVEAMEANTLTNTPNFVRSVQNSLAFHYPEQYRTKSLD